MNRDRAVEDEAIEGRLRPMVEPSAAAYATQGGVRVRHPALFDACLLCVMLGCQIDFAEVVEASGDDLLKVWRRYFECLLRVVEADRCALAAELVQERVIATVWQVREPNEQSPFYGAVHGGQHRLSVCRAAGAWATRFVIACWVELDGPCADPEDPMSLAPDHRCLGSHPYCSWYCDDKRVDHAHAAPRKKVTAASRVEHMETPPTDDMEGNH